MSSVIHGGDIYQYGEEVLDFSSNINPLGLPNAVKEVLQKDWIHLQRYPDAEYRALRQAIADSFEGGAVENVLVGNGAAEIIYLLGQFFQGKRIVIVEPTFGEYREAITMGGGTVETVFYREEESWSLPLEEIIAKLPHVDGVWLGHPNNPTGRGLDRESLHILIEETRAWERFLILDEAFIDFTLDAGISGIAWLNEHPWLFVIRALTKWYALPGLRLGYGLGRPEWIAELRRRQIPWSVNSLAVEVGLTVMQETHYQLHSQDWIREERPFLVGELARVKGLVVYPTMANFILCKIDLPGWSAVRLKTALLAQGILIRDASSFVGLDERYFRVAVKRRRDHHRLIQAIRECLSGNES